MKINLEFEPEFHGDSLDYDVLTRGIERVVGVPGMTCELGVRQGGGSAFIMEALRATHQAHKVHIAIDPYGNIDYKEGNDEHVLHPGYTNTMRNEFMVELGLYCKQSGMLCLFFTLEDTEFFARFSDGVPVYRDVKTIETQYSFVHFDGPHTIPALKTEVEFFHPRCPTGAVWVFDDVGLYDHTQIDAHIVAMGWECYEQTSRKWAYLKS